ncbi:RagB/SusD family nutrient uptake outer membrane protein [Rhodocaloribacter litoris]|uniref:RagB/SusD family nutrient uptake outer membrane protein n=1 Tax=Rhodocaloribacter litoris TaxID=2558931 RepID=UPI0014234171|nr:RagB/SusD family nutrient uptake outer membrane protein [Rhodocaloribacter litoris]QXD14804.1 RagB/SusD family nutrient uptake outer membrane protein [Rhodocaloribacter litoris]
MSAMKRFSRVLLLLLGAVLGLSACDVLEEEIVSGITVDAYYNTPQGLRDAVNASYSFLRNFYADEQGANLTVFGTDATTNGGHGSFQYMNQYTAQLNGDATPVNVLWDVFYTGINTTNAAISRAAEITDMSEAEKNRLVGEAKFLRAHFYFILVQTFGPVHLTLEETQGMELEANRTPEPGIYDAIEQDLRDAIAALPATPPQWGRATEPAAKHMLALVLLTRAWKKTLPTNLNGWGSAPGRPAEADFTEAYELARSVIEDYNFHLLDRYAAVFDHDNEQHAEVIWSVQYNQDPRLNGFDGSGNPLGNRMHLFFRPHYEFYNPGITRSLEPGYGRPWIRFRPTQWGLENFRAAAPLDVDCRYHDIFQDVWYYNDPNNGNMPPGAAVGDTAIWVSPNNGITPEEIQAIRERNPGAVITTWEQRPINLFPSLKKFDDWKRESVNYTAGSRDFIVYRLAETYLNAAEALLMLGRTAEATAYVNAVRRRAACPGVGNEAIDITPVQLDLDFLLDERSRELYGEQKRWFDLKRTGKLLERTRKYNPEAAPNIREYHLLRPIPTNQILRSFPRYPQNPGY